MKTRSFVFVAALALAAVGCKKGEGGATDCATAITKSMELSKADMQKMPGMDDAKLQKLRDLGVQHCTDDKWPAAALDCMVAAKTEPDSRACYGKLSPEQQQKMNAAAMAAMTPPAAGSAAPQ